MKKFREWLEIREGRSAKFFNPESGDWRGGQDTLGEPVQRLTLPKPPPSAAPVAQPAQNYKGPNPYEDPDTGAILDQAKFNQWNADKRKFFAQKAAQPKPHEHEVYLKIQNALSKFIDEPENQGKSAEEIAKHPAYQVVIAKAAGVDTIRDVGQNMIRQIVQWFKSTADNRADYWRDRRKLR